MTETTYSTFRSCVSVTNISRISCSNDRLTKIRTAVIFATLYLLNTSSFAQSVFKPKKNVPKRIEKFLFTLNLDKHLVDVDLSKPSILSKCLLY